MKRDLDFIREILIKAEEISGEGATVASQVNFSTDNEKKIGYHFKLLIEAGLIEASVTKVGSGWFMPNTLERLTWEGNEFLDNIRNDTIWEKAKSIAKDKMSSVSLNVLASLAEDLVKNSI